ncbi:MAG: LLM class flavin-dependent oxidoreductase [Chloroflexi bacterium]|nr:LLM class flavin-dependent oxidoreductase [Chloroflexota bacterium]
MSTPRFSILLNAEHQHRVLIALARQIQRLGFAALWYADERFYRETYTGLAACALSTERIALGTGVTDPYTRHPALTAMAAGSLDELSDGRATIGFGAGRAGYHNIGIELIRPARRVREAIQIIRRLLAGEHLDYDGEIFQTRDLWLKFPTRPDIPIVLAADGPAMLRVAGELADGVMIGHCASPKILAEKLAFVREGQRRAGRERGPRVVARLDASVSRDRLAALHQAKVRLGRYLWIRYPEIAYLPQHGLSLPPELDRRLRDAGPPNRTHDLSAFARFADAIPDELVYPIKLAGTPSDVSAQIAALVQAGADEIMAYPLVPDGETVASTIDLVAEATGLTRLTPT